jgi:hypothetical protein
MKKYLSLLLLCLLIAFPAYGQDLKAKMIPLNGKLIQADDPTQIGTNFQTLQNLRYTDSHIKGVGGMTKINSSVLSSYPHVRNAYHFVKSNPVESHVLLHALNALEATPVIIESTTAIPSAGTINETTPVVSLTSTNAGFFATVPGDSVIFANGDQTLIWAGNEDKISAFIASSAAVTYYVTNSNDYTDILSNSRTSDDQVATLMVDGGNDANTMLLLHLDGADGSTTFTDSSTNTYAVTDAGDGQLDTAQYKFGLSSVVFDGTGDGLSAGAAANWTFLSDGSAWTIDKRYKVTSIGTIQTLFDTAGGSTNNAGVNATILTNGKVRVYVARKVAGHYALDFTTTDNVPLDTNWHHIAITYNPTGEIGTVYVDGTALAGTGTRVEAFSADAPANALKFGLNGDGASEPFGGWMDEIRVSNVVRWTTDFTAPSQAYGNASNVFLVGSKRPLQGAKFYVSTGNASASTMTVKEWQGTAWTTLSITDNTDTGATLAVTGTINWTASGAAKARYINGLSLYWYQFSFDVGSATLYQVTVDAPMQSISNLWDGQETLAIKCLKYDGSTYKDYSIEIADSSQSSYADLSSIAAAHALYLGFTEPQQAFDITFVAGSENGTAATTATVSFWNGSAWQVAGAVYDGTMTTTTALSKGGVIAFQAATKGTEFQTTISNEVPLYYYKIQFADALDADVKISEIRGIPSPPDILPFSFVTMYQGRAILLNENSAYKNKLLYSAYGRADVYNGTDSGFDLIGDSSEITGSCTLSLVLTSALEQLIITKKNQTYRIFGDGPENWELQLISGTVGCVAPKTMKTVSLPLDSQSNYIGRHIAIWQGSEGIYVSDGRTPSPIHNDIKNLFDKRSTTSINTSMIDKSVGFIDQENLEYHWLFASGTSTSLDKEYVFDLRRWKWYEIVRGTGKQLQFGFKVTDTYGNNYNYGTIDTGYVERLEYGNSFDSGNIVHTFQLGDIALAEIPLYETRAQYVNLAMVAKSTTTNLVNYTHYADTSTSGTTITMSPAATNKRIANVVANINSPIGVFHSPKLAMTTSNEATGFEPLYLGYFYKVEREHLH